MYPEIKFKPSKESLDYIQTSFTDPETTHDDVSIHRFNISNREQMLMYVTSTVVKLYHEPRRIVLFALEQNSS